MVWLGLLLGGVSSASACDKPYTVDQLLGDLVAVETALRGGEAAPAAEGAARLQAGVACLNEVVPGIIVGRTWRAIGAGLVAGGKEADGLLWMRTAVELESSFEYGIEDLPEGHPARSVYADALERGSGGDPVAVEGRTFVAGATVYLDGRKTTAPKARLDRPHLLQVDQGGVKSWVITGNAFPEEVFAPVAAVADAGKPKKPPKGPVVVPVGPTAPAEPAAPTEPAAPVAAKEPKPPKEPKAPKPAEPAASEPVRVGEAVVLERQRPWEKTPLMVLGGAVIAGAGGLYYWSYDSRQAFLAAETEEDLNGRYRQTNRLVLASMGVLAAGAGTLTWGIMVDGGTPLPRFSVRF